MSVSRRAALGALAVVALAACSTKTTGSSAPGIVVEDPWVRTTDGATDLTMSAAFMALVNPGKVDVNLVAASTSVAGMCQIHEMVMGSDGKMVMQEAKGGVKIPAGGHVHLSPGGYHVMLMDLKQKLAVGSEVTLELKFSDGTAKTITAPVKVFTEETDHYHTPAASASASMSMGSNG